jgi:hypothetical protein
MAQVITEEAASGQLWKIVSLGTQSLQSKVSFQGVEF